MFKTIFTIIFATFAITGITKPVSDGECGKNGAPCMQHEPKCTPESCSSK